MSYCVLCLFKSNTLDIRCLRYTLRQQTWHRSFCNSWCFSITCLAANMASVIPLPGMKPNCSSPMLVSFLSLLPVILSQIIMVLYIIILMPLYFRQSSLSPLLFEDWYNHTEIVSRSKIFCSRSNNIIFTPSSPKLFQTSTGITSGPIAFSFLWVPPLFPPC